MTFPNAKLRELVFQFLFCQDFTELEEKDGVKTIMHVHKVTKKWATLAHTRANKILEKVKEIDEKISLSSKDYTFDRIPRIEKNLLRLGIFELLLDDKIPAKVAISEAIRLSRKFSTPESAKFINAVLDSLYQQSENLELANSN